MPLIRCLLVQGRRRFTNSLAEPTTDLHYFYLLYPVSQPEDRLKPIVDLADLSAQIADDPIFGDLDLAGIIAIESEETQRRGGFPLPIEECPDQLGPVQRMYDHLIRVYSDETVRRNMLALLDTSVRLLFSEIGSGGDRKRRAQLIQILEDQPSCREVFYLLLRSTGSGAGSDSLLRGLLTATIDHILDHSFVPMQTFDAETPVEMDA
jgi:hypothetical protein